MIRSSCRFSFLLNFAMVVSSIYCIIYNLISVRKIETYVPYTEIPLNMNCNYFAVALLVGISFCLLEYKIDKNKQLNKVFFIILSISLFLAMGRMAILTYFIICLVYLIDIIRTSRSYKIILLPFIGVLFVLMVFKLSRFGDSRFNQLLVDIKNKSLDRIFENRKDVYLIAKQLIISEPILGYGINGSQMALNEKYKEYGFGHLLKHEYHAHNQFLQFALYGGVFFSFIYLLIMVWPIFYFEKFSHNLCLFLSFSFPSLTDSPLTDWRVALIFLCTYFLLFFENYKKLYVSA